MQSIAVVVDDYGWTNAGYLKVMPVMYFYGIVYWGAGIVFDEDQYILASMYHEEVGNIKGDRL